MKTSLAKTFKDFSEGVDSKDLVYTTENAVRSLKDETGADVARDSVFVVLPIDRAFKSSRVSRLLANQKLRDRHEEIYEKVDQKTEQLLKKLKAYSGLKKEDIAPTLADDVTHDKRLFLVSLEQLRPRVSEEKDPPFGDVVYSEIFSDDVVALLESPGFKAKLAKYIEVYDSLLGNSTFFKKGIFDHTNATTVAKNLKANKYFKADHSLFLNTKTGRREIKTEKDLEQAIKDEMDSISSDGSLAKMWAEVDAEISNTQLRNFRDYLAGNRAILPELESLPRFRQKLWVAYLYQSLPEYNDLLKTYEDSRKDITAIIKEALEEKTKWDGVINKFNERFKVPFRIEVDNQTDVILRLEAPVFKFIFKGEDDRPAVPIKDDPLWEILSNGERRALYLLNIIFEINARKEDGQETLFVVDDIADSFDYKNKYAIIEYLMELSQSPNFYQIIMTHNFDFFRTIESRFVGYGQCRMAYRLSNQVVLKPAEGIRNPFIRDWKPKFYTDARKRIASIPFIRNIIEYTRGEDDPDYLKLTSLLHRKQDTERITEGDLSAIFNKVFNSTQTPNDPTKTVVDLLEAEIGSCISAPEGANFEHKILLSISIRLKAEKFMIKKINDSAATSALEHNQTSGLFDLYRNKFPGDAKSRDTIEKVILMTPENIHVNSFMYEPILDMSDTHLKKLYGEVCGLK